MRKPISLLGLGLASAAVWGASPAGAAPKLRTQVSQKGDMAWIGNTLAQECAGTARAPVVGTVSNCGTNTGDTAPDVFWRSDDPADGQARARSANTVAQARSTAVLTLPVGATVTHARLYWGAQIDSNNPDASVTFERRGGFSTPVAADESYSLLRPGSTTYWYESTANVTALIQANGAGSYRVSGVDSSNLVNADNDLAFAGWSLVVFYQLATDPLRNLTLFDGLDFVQNGSPASVTLSGFQVPNSGFDAKLGVLAYEGDFTLSGDALIFNGQTLSDGTNAANNFFNSSRSWLGAPVSVAGDLPQMDGMPASMSGIDLDVVNVSPYLLPGQTSATIQATSSGDTYVIGAFATSIATYQPDFSSTVKSANDVNGGAVMRGDTIEYSITPTNTGNDVAVEVVLIDPLPAGVTYVPGSIRITSGANSTPPAKTDAAADDQAEYDALTRTVTVRLGTGATSTLGGTMAIGESTTIKFQVTIDPTTSGVVANQASISAKGQKGNPNTTYPTGNGTPGGNNPTTISVDECTTSANCTAPKPVCNTLVMPRVCVGCLADSDCGLGDSGRVCDTPVTTCRAGCRGSGGNGCPAGQVCTSTTTSIGLCVTAPVDAGADASDAGADVSSDGAGGADGNDGASGDGAGGADGNDGAADDGNDGAGGAGGGDGGDGGDGNDGAGGASGSDGGDGATGDGSDGNDGAGRGDGGDGAADGDAIADARDGAGGADGSDGGDGAGGADGGDGSAGRGGSAGAGGSAGEGGAAGAAGSDDDDGAAGSGPSADASTGAAGTGPGGTIEGGGCSCSVPGSGSSLPSGGVALLLGLASAVIRRRKRAA